MTYVQADPSLDPSNSLDSFDDIVMYKEYWQTQSPDYLLPPMGYVVYVTDQNDYGRIFTANGNDVYQGQFGSGFGGTGHGTLNGTSHIAIDSSNNIWVSDGPYVEEFNSSGTFISQIGTNGYANGNLRAPWGFAFDTTGNIWIADTGNNRVQEFNSSGVFQMGIGAGYNGVSGTIGSNGAGNGQFNSPNSIAIDSGGNLWVADNGNNRVQKFNSSGVYQSQFGSAGSGNGQFYSPNSIIIDSGGNFWVTDSGNYRVQKFNSSGVYQSQFGSLGTGPE
jgi:sugar lactone lactonase YvrE